jgi:hypothetical protein
MKRLRFALLIAAALFLTGCPAPLTTGLPSDIVLALGRFSPAQGVIQVRGALGGTIDVPVLITDQSGREVTGSYEVTFTLSLDADITTTGDNIAAGTLTIAAGSLKVVSIDVPAAAVAAVYTLFGVVDAADAVTNNNLSSVSVDIGATNSPDLEIAVGSAPDWAAPGSTITVGYGVYNTGYAKVESGTAFTVQFTVNLSAVDELMGEETITLDADLHPQAQITRQRAVSMPTLEQMAADAGVSTTELDDFQVDFDVNVDTDNTVPELPPFAEGDTVAFSVLSGNRKPDLVMDDIVMPDGFVAAKMGGPARLALKILNEGTAATGEYGLDLYVDVNGDNAFDGGDFMIHQWAEADTPVVPYDLAGGGNNVIFLNPPAEMDYPAGITAGTYNIRAEITTTVDEYDAGNNDATELNIDFVDT